MGGIVAPTYQSGFYSPTRGGMPKYPSLWRGCVGAWNPGLGPTGLRLFDQTRYGRHGTLTNMASGTDWVSSEGRSALDFDGSNDFVSHGQVINASDTRLSVSLWFFVTTWTNNATLITSGINPRNYILTLRTGNPNSFTLNAFSAGANDVASNIVGPNSWINAAFTATISGEISLYLNGRHAQTISAGSSTIFTTATNRIGGPGAAYFPGLIDDVRVYNRILSQGEIATLATRRGVAYEIAPRQRSYFALFADAGPPPSGFKPYWARRTSQILGGR